MKGKRNILSEIRHRINRIQQQGWTITDLYKRFKRYQEQEKKNEELMQRFNLRDILQRFHGCMVRVQKRGQGFGITGILNFQPEPNSHGVHVHCELSRASAYWSFTTDEVESVKFGRHDVTIVLSPA